MAGATVTAASSQASDSVYAWLLDNAACIAADYPEENELGAAAFASHSLLAPRPTNPSLARRLASWRVLVEPHSYSQYRTESSGFAEVDASPRAVILHEGYRVDPARESASAVEALRIAAQERLVATTEAAWLRWGLKHSFRRRVRELFGDNSVPPGVEVAWDRREPWEQIGDLAKVDPNPRVLKFAGAGGAGNIVIPAGTAPRETAHGLRNPGRYIPDAEGMVVLETWLPFATSLCISFLLLPGHAVKLVAVTEQLVDLGRATAIGTASDTTLDDADVEAACRVASQLANEMAVDGVVGMIGIDLIVGFGWADGGIVLPSGLLMRLVECNPRMNRHNRVGMLVERLARYWGMAASSLAWSLRDASRPPTMRVDELDLRRPRELRPFQTELADHRRTMIFTVWERP